MLYFSHDVRASRSADLTALRSEMGSAAVDAYWMIIELIHEEETALVLGQNQPLTKAVSCWLATDEKTLMQSVELMVENGLLIRIEGENDKQSVYTVTSARAQEQIRKYQQKAETARENGKGGGRKPKKNQRGTEAVSESNQDAGVRKRKSKSKDIDISTDVDILSEKPHIPYDAIISYLNEKAGTNYRSSAAKSRQHINARWNEGYRLDDFKAVIDKKVAEWLNDPKMCKFLRPETLFGTKFEGYLNAPAPKGVKDYAKYDR